MSPETNSVRKALVGLRANLQTTLRSVIAMEQSAEELNHGIDSSTLQRLATDVDALRALHHATTDLLLAMDSAVAGVIADSSVRFEATAG